MEEKPEGWVVAVGVLTVLCLVTTLGLVAAGGWLWFAKFLESAAANWVQAIGSIAAILAAGRFVNAQIRASQDALVESQKNAEALESERRRLRRRESLLAMEDLLGSALFAVHKMPVTVKESDRHGWRVIKEEFQRLREDLSRIHGAESLGMGLLKDLGIASFTLHQVLMISTFASDSENPIPFDVKSRDFFYDKLKELHKKCQRALFSTSTQQELKVDMESFAEKTAIQDTLTA